MRHPSDDQLERYSLRRMSEAEMAPLEEHLLICDVCRTRLTLTDLEVEAIKEALRLRKKMDSNNV
ncbi:MAG: hypothetical protein ACRD5L_02645 [Bryobacteraceae bacterium]